MMRMLRALLALSAAVVWLGANARAEVFLTQPPAQWAQMDTLEWTIFDVDEGDAMLLRCGGESMLVDGGPAPFRADLRDALDARGLRHSLKYILTTHFHDDHLDGVIRLFEYGFTAGEYLHPYNAWAIRNEKRMTTAINRAKKNNIPIRQVGHGHSLTLVGADIEIWQCTSIRGTNSRSLVLKVTFGQSTLLLCADIDGKVQRYFSDGLGAVALEVDLIKLPHHAITPVNSLFLDDVSPLAAVVTNRQKDVDSKSLTQLEGRAIPALFSGDGSVYAVTDGTDWYLYQTPDVF